MSIIHPQDVRTLVLTRSTEGLSAPLARFIVLSPLVRMLSGFYTNSELPTNPWVGYPTIEAYCLRQSYYFSILVSAQPAFVERDTGFEPALPVWKTGVLAADTNPA